MSLATACYRLATAIALATTVLTAPLAAQQSPVEMVVISASVMEAFTAAHVEVATLRTKLQAELAEPKSKKPEVQASLRDKLQVNTERILKQHGLTESEFAQLTRAVSTNDALRKQFDEAVAKLTAGRGG